MACDVQPRQASALGAPLCPEARLGAQRGFCSYRSPQSRSQQPTARCQPPLGSIWSEAESCQLCLVWSPPPPGRGAWRGAGSTLAVSHGPASTTLSLTSTSCLLPTQSSSRGPLGQWMGPSENDPVLGVMMSSSSAGPSPMRSVSRDLSVEMGPSLALSCLSPGGGRGQSARLPHPSPHLPLPLEAPWGPAWSRRPPDVGLLS